MADIALVFHWPPEAMANMPLEELAEWRERARQRHQAAEPRKHKR